MKKKSLGIWGIALLTLTLAACGGDTTSLISGSDGGSTLPSSSEEAADYTNDDLKKGVTSYTDASSVSHPINRSQIYNNSNDPHVNSDHEASKAPHVLVAPFTFLPDETDSKQITATADYYNRIKLTFTGSDEELAAVGGNISVQSFYQQSSFGKGNLDITVLPEWVTYQGTPSKFLSASSSSGAGIYAAEYVRTYYLAEYEKENHGALGADAKPFTYFDNDYDGFVDLIWTVYTYPSASSTDWWAYVTYTGNSSNITRPAVKTIAWASIDFLANGNGGYDSHTFIHETGHTLGIDDYYDYNNAWAPMGGVDYMDHNLGDHNSYTKFSYGWVNPWIVTEDELSGGKSAIVTLRAATTSGDCLVLASPGYNGTAFDEYLMVELVGPYGICESDYQSGYQGTSGFTKGGIRILHVDARVYSTSHDSYLTSAKEIYEDATAMRLSNSSGGGRIGVQTDGDYFPLNEGKTKSYMCQSSLIESTIPSGDNWTTMSTYNATNSSLFMKNARFSLSDDYPWGSTYMPSKSNLWNKAKTTTGWSGNTQKYSIDENISCNYFMKVLSIDTDPTYGAVAKVKITLN